MHETNHRRTRREWLQRAAAVGGGAIAAGPRAALAQLASAPSPPPAKEAAGTVRIHPSLAESSWEYASKALVMPWTTGGGDWFDANDVPNGPKPLRSLVTKPVTTIDIAGIDGDLLLVQGSNFDAPTIDGKPAVGFWMHSSSNRAIALPTQYLSNDSKAIVLNPARGKVLTLACSQPGFGMQVFKLRPPAVVELPMRANPPGLLPPDMGTLDPISQAVVYAAVGMGAGAGYANGTGIWAYDPQPGVDAAHANMPYLRCAITPANQKGIGWFWWHQPVAEIYLRYCLWLEDDIELGMTEQGVKLPGPEGDEASWRLIHSRPDHANPGLYAAFDYRYSGDTPSGGYGITSGSYNGAILHTGRWYVFEQHAKSDTFTNGAPNADGVGEVWINGHPVFASSKIQWFNNPASRFKKFFINLYHGGMGFPTQNIHYRLAKLARSTTRIGIPNELLAASRLPK